MNYIYILFLILVPLTTFFTGFLISRQLRALENVPTIRLMLVQYRILISAATGVVISGIFALLIFFTTEFSISQVIAFIGMAIIATVSEYFGLKIGWGRPLPIDDNITSVNPTPHNSLAENVTVDSTLGLVRITINSKKRWIWFVMSLFPLAIGGLCALPILGLMIISFLQDYLPESMNVIIWIIVGGLVLYIVYARFQDTLEYLFDKEIIEIDNLSVKIENSGSGFESRKEYSADNIKRITTMFSFGGTPGVMRRSPFVNSNMPAFIMWHNHGLKRYRTFGRAVDLADAQRILETIYSKFPQYKG